MAAPFDWEPRPCRGAGGGDVLVLWAERTGRRRAGVPGRGGLRFAFYGRVSTEDWQDPVTSRARQREQAGVLVAGHGRIVAEFFDSGHSRSLPWARRPQAATQTRRQPRTDWRQIAALYSELLRFDPSPVIEANRAIAVAYAEGPAAGLAILDTLAASSRLARWPQLHIARAALFAGCGRREDAVAAYRDALALEPAGAVRRHITGQIAALGAASAPTEEI